MSGHDLPTKKRLASNSSGRLALGSLLITLTVFSAIAIILPVNAFPVSIPTYYLNRSVTLTGNTLSIQAPSSQSETSIQIPRGSSVYFYSQPQAEGLLSASQWTITIYAQAGPGQSNPGSLTVEISLYSIDGTTQDAIVGSSTGNTIPTTTGRIVVQITGTSVAVRNGDRLTLRVYAETGPGNAASVTVYYDGQGSEPSGDASRIVTSSSIEEIWRQDFEFNPFAVSSVNRYWQAMPTSGVSQNQTLYYSGSHSLHVSDSSGAGAYARYDFNTLNNPSYQGLPRGTTLSFYWLSTANAKGSGILSGNILIVDQGRSYEFYWYWSSTSTSKPPSLYSGTSRSGGTYMGTISLGVWTKNELYDWQKHAEVALGLSFTNPSLVSISIFSLGVPTKPTDVYWDNLFVSSYTPAATPSMIQEGQTATLSLLVTGAVPATTYQFEFAVTSPAGNTTTSTISYTTGVTETSFTVTRHYPDDFQTGGSLVGLYNVTIRQMSPVYLIPQGASFIADYIKASTGFTIQLVNKAVFQRTETIRIQATGYNTLERATITIIGLGSTYTLPVQADPTGLIVTTWQSPRDAPTGNYTVTVEGSTTVKPIPDEAVLLLTPAVLQLSQFNLDQSTIERTRNATVYASFAYPDQTLLQDGMVAFQLRRPDGLVMAQFTSVTETDGIFVGSVKIPTDAPTGNWQMILTAWGSGDVYGNTGPASEAVIQLAVTPAVLQIQSKVNINSTQTARTLVIQASITYPDGSPETIGQASAVLQYNGLSIANVPLSYDMSRGVWLGYYQIKDSDPEGLWLIVMSAQDLAGPVTNSVANVVHNVLINVPPPSWNFGATLVAGVLVSAGALIAFILWNFPREKCLSVELETDKVMQTVNKVQSTDFFRSIRDQLRTASANNQSS